MDVVRVSIWAYYSGCYYRIYVDTCCSASFGMNRMTSTFNEAEVVRRWLVLSSERVKSDRSHLGPDLWLPQLPAGLLPAAAKSNI